MLRQWQAMRLKLVADRGWSGPEVEFVLKLAGFDTRVGHREMVAQPPVREIWRCAMACQPSPEFSPLVWDKTADLYVGVETTALPHPERVARLRQLLPDREAGRAALLAFVDEQIATLTERREAAYEAVEAPQRAAAITGGLIDTGKAGQLRQRYERTNELTMHRSLNGLTRYRKAKGEHAETRAASAPWSGARGGGRGAEQCRGGGRRGQGGTNTNQRIQRRSVQANPTRSGPDRAHRGGSAPGVGRAGRGPGRPRRSSGRARTAPKAAPDASGRSTAA